MAYVSHLCLYVQCVWCPGSRRVEEGASVFRISGVGLGCGVCMWRVYAWYTGSGLFGNCVLYMC